MMRFIYFRNNKESDNHAGIASIGYIYNEDAKTIDIGAAFCHPEDKFSKKLARTIIEGRIKEGKVIKLTGIDTPPKYEDMVKYVKDELNSAVPETDDRAFMVKTGNFTNYPTFAGIRLPVWFAGIF